MEEVEKIVPSPENKEVSRGAFEDLEETDRKIVAGVDLPEVIVKDGKKMRLVSEKTILALIASPLPPPVPAYSAEFFRCKMGLNDEDTAIMLQGIQASHDIHDFEADVVQQYKANGCAYREIPEQGYFCSKDVDEELHAQALAVN